MPLPYSPGVASPRHPGMTGRLPPLPLGTRPPGASSSMSMTLGGPVPRRQMIYQGSGGARDFANMSLPLSSRREGSGGKDPAVATATSSSIQLGGLSHPQLPQQEQSSSEQQPGVQQHGERYSAPAGGLIDLRQASQQPLPPSSSPSGRQLAELPVSRFYPEEKRGQQHHQHQQQAEGGQRAALGAEYFDDGTPEAEAIAAGALMAGAGGEPAGVLKDLPPFNKG